MKKVGTPIPDSIKQVLGEQDADRLEEMVTALVQCGDTETLGDIIIYFEDALMERYKRR